MDTIGLLLGCIALVLSVISLLKLNRAKKVLKQLEKDFKEGEK